MTLSADERIVVEPPVLDLLDERARDATLVGAKAANLARAAAAGMPVVDGFVVTIAACDDAHGDARPLLGGAAGELVETARVALEADGSGLVVRSSSAVEDTAESSMAGLFRSVVGVRGRDDFGRAVGTVLASAGLSTYAPDGKPGRAPMAVLVQRHVECAVGGILFGADPVEGRTDRVVVVAAPGGPHRLVAGDEDGSHEVLTRRGRRVAVTGGTPVLDRAQRRQLARLARDTAALFGGPQDIEWAFDHDGRLWLLQSRPITALGRPVAPRGGPVLGPGPVAETFPEPLAPLEADLWVTPVADALRVALPLAGVASRRAVARSPVVTTVAGRVAADLDLFGGSPTRRRWVARLDPRPSARRLVAAWRVGRLRAALPALAEDLLARADAQLRVVPALDQLDDDDLLTLLETSGRALVSVHGHEVLVGLLVAAGTTSTTGASEALRALAQGRERGLGDDEIVARYPVVLALVPPGVRGSLRLPPAPPASDLPPPSAPDDLAFLRESLRLRARWLQELSGRAAWELGRRLARAGVLPAPGYVRLATVDELRAMTVARRVPSGLEERGERTGAPLPAAFRLALDGSVVPVGRPRAGSEGRGAGGGRGEGVVHGGDGLPEPGAVLVVRTLDPGLAPLLPRLGGLVAETGTVLSHLAILARELGVPTVVGVPDAVSRFAPGTRVVVDGTRGDVVAAGGLVRQ